MSDNEAYRIARAEIDATLTRMVQLIAHRHAGQDHAADLTNSTNGRSPERPGFKTRQEHSGQQAPKSP